MFEQGQLSAAEIAIALDVHAQTVRAWRREYRDGGLKALAARPHPGPPCRLSLEQKQQLLALLSDSPKAHGYDTPIWTTQLVARLIQERFDVQYHHDHVGAIMHQLGYSYQKPAKQPRERDEARVQRWHRQEWPVIASQSRQRQSTLVFVDEAGFSMIPSIKKTWAPRGQTPVVKHRNRWYRKVSVIGGLTVSPDGQHLDASFDWYPGEHIKQPQVATFLEHLVEEFGDRLDVVWDNLSSHGGPLIRAFLAHHPDVRLHRFPPYAPDLNPIETLWSLAKYHRMANHGIFELDELHERAQEAVADVTRQQDLLIACVKHAGLADALWPSRDQ